MMNKLFFPIFFGIYLIPLSINGSQSPLAIRSDLVAIAKAQKTQQLISPTHNLKRTPLKRESLFSAGLRQQIGTNPKLGLKTIENRYHKRFGRERALSDPTVSSHPKKPLLSDLTLKSVSAAPSPIARKLALRATVERIASKRSPQRIIDTILDCLHPPYVRKYPQPGKINLVEWSPKITADDPNRMLVEIAGEPFVFLPSRRELKPIKVVPKKQFAKDDTFYIGESRNAEIEDNSFQDKKYAITVKPNNKGQELISVASKNSRDMGLSEILFAIFRP